MTSLKSAVFNHFWQIASPPEREVITVVQKYSLPVLLAQILVHRKIEMDKIPDFLSPSLKNFLPNPSSLKDMDKGVALLKEAIFNKVPVAVLGDYDVDGTTSSALLYRFFQDIGALLPIVYIPDRLKEGYGPSIPAIQSLISQGVKILITVDCGTTAFEALSYAKDQGMTVIIIDHHVAEAKSPPADAFINPNRIDENSPLTHLAAVGLCFLFVVGLNRALRLQEWYNAQRPEPDLLQYLDFVALGTVCDVVALRELNRAYVYQGLKVMAKRQNLGIRCLMDVAAVQQSPTPYHLGYLIGPRINAGSRIAQSDIGFKLLTTQDSVQAESLALCLNELNIQRRELEKIALEEALEQAYTKKDDSVIVVWGKDWSIGIIGIVAGRIKEIFKKPCCVITFQDPKIGKGSARSIANVNIGGAIHQAKHQGLIEEGGGHAMAGGFSIKEENLAAFCQFINDFLREEVEQNPPFLLIEGALNATAVTVDLVRSLAVLGPFGAGHAQPRFVIRNMRIAKIEILKQQHLRCLLLSEDQCFIKAMAFQCVNSELGEHLLSHQGRMMHFAGVLDLNIWNGKESVSFIIEDISL